MWNGCVYLSEFTGHFIEQLFLVFQGNIRKRKCPEAFLHTGYLFLIGFVCFHQSLFHIEFVVCHLLFLYFMHAKLRKKLNFAFNLTNKSNEEDTDFTCSPCLVVLLPAA